MLGQAFIYLLAALIAVPLARRLGFGSVLGYLAAGVALGPFGLGLVGEESAEIQHFAEFGVVMMLFLIGLELEPGRLWRLRGPIFGLGGLQLIVTAALVALVAWIARTSFSTGVVLGLTLAMSSTAIGLQTLQEKGFAQTEGGRMSFAILLFQDLAVIPILAVIPLLALRAPEQAHGIGALHGWQQALAILGVVLGIILGGRYLSRPLFRIIALTRMRELFTALALALVIGIALLMGGVGLSPALGTFLAGVVLANSEYRHELMSDIEPFKGLLLGLFFLTVGAGVRLDLVGAQPLQIALIVVGVVAGKAIVLALLSRFAFKLPWPDTLVMAVSLSQVGEFAFVLLGFAASAGLLLGEEAAAWTGVVVLTMACSPVLFLALEKLVLPRLQRQGALRPEDDVGERRAPVIVAGCGRVGNMVVRLLRANGVETSVLDLNANTVDVMRRVGIEAFYGDASRPDLLEAAGAEQARLLVLSLDNAEKSMEIAENARRRFPHLRILVRVSGHHEAYRFLKAGFDDVFRETSGTALDLGFEALRAMGVRGHQAHRAVATFRRHNEHAMRELARHWGDDKRYFGLLKAKIEEGEEMLRRSQLLAGHVDHAWDDATLRDEVFQEAAEATKPEGPLGFKI